MTMCDKELLVGYLYDEVAPAERRAMETHLLTCGECRSELKGLRGVRTSLTAWAPPAPDLEFQVVRQREAAATTRRAWSIAPAWGLAAAAVLVLSVASAIANVEVKYGADGLTVRTGAARLASPPPSAATVQAGAVLPVRDEELRAEIQTLGRRLADLETGSGGQAVLASAHTATTPVPPADVLRAVRQLISDSESRQEQELARRVSQVLRDVEGNRRVDLDRTQRALAQVQGVLDTTIIRQRETDNHVYRVAQQVR